LKIQQQHSCIQVSKTQRNNTEIPNMVGFNGLIQKLANRPIFDIHVPLDLDALVKAHELVGFNFWNVVIFCLSILVFLI